MAGNSSSAGRRDSGIAGWLLALIFFGLAAGIVAAGNFYYRNYEKHYCAEVERQLSAIADLKVGELVQWRKERLEDGDSVFKNASFTALVRRLLKHPEDGDARRQLQGWIGKIKANSQYDRIFLLDTQGVERISAPETPEPVTPHLAQNAVKVLQTGQVAFLDFHRDAPDLPVHLAILVPLLDEADNGHSLGVLALRIDPETYLYPFIQHWPTPSPTAETLLVRPEGNEVVFLNELRFQKNAALTLRAPLDQMALPAARAALGQEGVMEGLDYRGVPVVAALRTIPDSPWSLVARMDAAEVYAPIRAQLRLVVMLIGALLFGAGASIALLWRQQSVRFYREKAAATETIRETNAYLENLFNYANAPIIVWDLQFKITRFNPAFESLTGKKAGEVIGQSLEILFPPALVDSSMALIQKTTGGERWETVEISILARDESIRTVLWNSATVFAADGTTPVATIAQGHDITARKRAEEALRESEKRFRSLAVATSQIIWSTDAQGQVCGPMPSFQAYTGQSDEEIRGSGWAATLHPDDVARTIKVWQEAVAAKTGYLTEYRLRRRDGVYRHFTARGAPVVTDDGRILEWIGTCSDITERKQAEEALRELQAFYHSLVAELPAGVFRKDSEGRYVFVSPWFCRLKGMRKEEFLGKTPQEAAAKPDATEQATKYAAEGMDQHALIMQTGNPVELVEEYTDAAGRTQFVHAIKSPVINSEGKVIGTQGLLFDITERKRAEEALRESEERFTQFMRNLPAMTFIKDHDRRIVFMNERVGRVFGLTAAHCLGKVTEDLWPGPIGQKIREEDERVLGNGEDMTVVQEIPTPEGLRVFRAIKFLIPRGPQPPLLGDISLDVTEILQAGEKVRQLNAELEQRVRERTAELEAANKELEAFSYSVSHDLRAPLRAIDGFSRILLEDYAAQLDAEGKDHLTRVRTGAQRMAQLIDDLLKLAHAARAEMRRAAVDLTALAGEIAAELERAEPARRVRWVIAANLAATGDPPLLRVALGNLLNNAWKFTGPQKDACIEFGTTRAESGPAFFVRDNGVGFNMAYAAKLFGPFQRLHATAEFPGTGIGLATVQRIILRHGGRVWAEGEVNHGATFHFTLPETIQPP